ncbi:MAG: hypothetical protein MJH10_18805 [Epibacterium sp.]|nr:hypothetical protein [Epibacterium sp.]NQX75535.1 hypothetical protein [Epibacterium sp.]
MRGFGNAVGVAVPLVLVQAYRALNVAGDGGRAVDFVLDLFDFAEVSIPVDDIEVEFLVSGNQELVEGLSLDVSDDSWVFNEVSEFR